MRDYEKRLKLDQKSKKLQENTLFKKVIILIWTLISFALIYYFLRYLLTFVNEIKPYSNEDIWFEIGRVGFIEIDLVYIFIGWFSCTYGAFRLVKITKENHKAKKDDSKVPTKLLTTGYYSKTRHPMYGAFILLQAVFLLSLRSLIGLILGLAWIAFQYFNAYKEEKKNLIPIFDEKYLDYKKQVRFSTLRLHEIILIAAFIIFSFIGFFV